jgi:RNA polymerase sigma-70 factor (ECF subfamily)
VDDPTGRSDLQLAEGLLCRDEDALAEVYRRHARSVSATAATVLGNASACDDVVAEVFLALWLKPESFDPERGSLIGFLRLKARGRSIDIVRSEVARRTREERDARATRRRFRAVDEDFLDAEAVDQMRRALDSLVERERQPIELALFTGMTYREVAAYLELPEGTVKARIRAGLLHMKAIYELKVLTDAEAERSLQPRPGTR